MTPPAASQTPCAVAEPAGQAPIRELFNLGRDLALAGRFGRAAEALNELVYRTDACRSAPELFRYGLLNLAEAYRAQGRLDQALDRLNALLEVEPGFAVALLERAECLLGLAEREPCPGNLDAAESDVHRALETGIGRSEYIADPDALTASLHIAGGRCRRMRGDAEGAEAAFRRAAGTAPNDPIPPLLLADLLADAGRYAEAESAYNACIGLREDLFEAHYNLADCLERAGRDAEAAAVFAAALRLRPDSRDGHLRLGALHMQRGEYAQAARCFRRAAAVAPLAAEPLLSYSLAQLALGRPRQALQAAGDALLLPDVPDDLRRRAAEMREFAAAETEA